MAGPHKRSVMISGHSTSVTLEPEYWDALAKCAERRALPLNALIAQIDAERVKRPDPVNLASALRVWILRDLQAGLA